MDEEILLRTQNSCHSETTGPAWSLAYLPSKSQPSYVIRPCLIRCRVDKNSNLEGHDRHSIRDGTSMLCSGISCRRYHAPLSMVTLPTNGLLCHLFSRFHSHTHSYAQKTKYYVNQDISKDSEDCTIPLLSGLFYMPLACIA